VQCLVEIDQLQEEITTLSYRLLLARSYDVMEFIIMIGTLMYLSLISLDPVSEPYPNLVIEFEDSPIITEVLEGPKFNIVLPMVWLLISCLYFLLSREPKIEVTGPMSPDTLQELQERLAVEA